MDFQLFQHGFFPFHFSISSSVQKWFLGGPFPEIAGHIGLQRVRLHRGVLRVAMGVGGAASRVACIPIMGGGITRHAVIVVCLGSGVQLNGMGMASV